MAKLERILSMTDQSVQFWLRTVDEQDVLNGMLAVNAEIRQKILDNLSPRARVAVRDYTESHTNLDQRIVDASLDRLEGLLQLIR